MSVPATIDRLDNDLQQVSSGPETVFSYRIRNYNDYTIRVKLYDALIASIHATTAPTLELDVPGFTEQIDDPGVDFEVALAARCVTGSAYDDRVPPANPPQIELLLREDGEGDSFNDSGRKPLAHSQPYIDVTFSKTQVSNQWKLTGSCISNLIDASPLNLWVTTITNKTKTGFRAQLNGIPDTSNYRLDWAVVGITVDQNPATTYTLTGPVSGNINTASTDFTVSLPDNTSVASPVTITPHVDSDGAFTPSTVILATDTSVATFTYTPASGGVKTISVTNSGGLTNPVSLSYQAGLFDGDSVSSWLDSSTNTNNASMTGSSRPIFKTAIVNGKPVVRFTSDGTSGLNLDTPISGNWPFTVFAVMKPSASGNVVSALGGNGTSSMPYSTLIQSNNVYISDRDGFKYDANPNQTAFHVISGVLLASGSSALLFDGSVLTESLFALASSGDFSTIGYGAVTSAYSDGDIAEIIIYNADVGATDRANIEKYLGTKYGITVAGGTAVQPDTVAGLKGWWKADSLG